MACSTLRGNDEYRYHQRQLENCCRICGQLAVKKGASKRTLYICKGSEQKLKSVFHVQIEEDQLDVHPQYFCNTCNTKMLQYAKDDIITSRMTVMIWEPHSSRQCRMCELFRLKGRPKKNRSLQKNGETLERLDLSTSKSWSDPQPLDPSRFLEPSQGIPLSDLQCQECMCVVDRPIQTGCGKLMCYTCVAAHLHTEGRYPCCGKDHQTSSLSPAGDVVAKIIGTLLQQHC